MVDEFNLVKFSCFQKRHGPHIHGHVSKLFKYSNVSSVDCLNRFVKRFQPDKYESWVKGQDNGPHPESNANNSSPVQINEKLPKK